MVQALRPIDALGTARYLGAHAGAGKLFFVFLRAFHFLLHPGARSSNKDDDRAIERRYKALLERDLENVRVGRYPRELLFEFPTMQFLRLAPTALTEIPRIFWRRLRRDIHDLPEIENRDTYPAYYLRNFHWQTDGWFS